MQIIETIQSLPINDFLGIAIVGVLLSLAFEGLQRKFGTGEAVSKLIVVSLSLIVGSIYYFLRETVYWQTITGVLAAASTVYAFVFASKSSKKDNFNQ